MALYSGLIMILPGKWAFSLICGNTIVHPFQNSFKFAKSSLLEAQGVRFSVRKFPISSLK